MAICSLKLRLQHVINSDNGLAPNRKQAIIWTSDGLVYRCIYASLGLNVVQCRNDDVDVFIHILYACFFKYCVLFVHSRRDVFIVFILCIHWPATMFHVYDFNLCVFDPVLGQRWPNKRVQSKIKINKGGPRNTKSVICRYHYNRILLKITLENSYRS